VEAMVEIKEKSGEEERILRRDMDEKPKVIILRTAGTNCDAETAFAFKYFGAEVDSVHINKLLKRQINLKNYHILSIPGGFTYGDDIASGQILANELRIHLGEDIQKFITDKKLIIGICNGFQVLVKAGLLPGGGHLKLTKGASLRGKVTLVSNDSGKFESRWTHLKVENKGVWTEGLEDMVYLPVAHAEGKFVPSSRKVLRELIKNGQIAFRYCADDGGNPDYPANPNGSTDQIAGITDITGRILGLMPHPERHFLFCHHPFWTRLKTKGIHGEGAKIFDNGLKYIRKNFL